MINKLIEQIGGRERLEFLSEYRPNVVKGQVNFREVKMMARALLSVLDAKPVGTVSIVQDLYAIPRRNIATVNIRPDLVLSEMRDGDNLYTTPPAARAPEWSNAQCMEFLAVAFRHCDISGDIEMDDIRLGVKMANAAAPAPGVDDVKQG